MKRTIVGTLALMLLFVTACIQPVKPAVAPPSPEPARELTDEYLAVIDEMLPGMSAENLVDREQPQQEFEQICFEAGRPGAEAQRAALCQAMLARLGPQTAKPARVWLLRQLERLSGRESVAGLAKLLSDEDPRIRELARRVLQNNPAPSAGDALRAELLRLEGPTQWHVGLINALAARPDRDQAFVHHLIDVARHGDDAMASAAIAALGDLGGPDAVEALYETWRGDNDACAALAAAALLRVADRLVFAGEHDRAAKMYLDLYLSSIPTRLRSAALRGLAVAAADDAVPRLRDVVHGKLDPEMRLQAVRLLGDIPGWLVTNTLVAELNRVPPEVQVAVLDVLAARGDRMVKPVVINALRSEDQDVRIAVLEALQQLGDASDVVLLARAGADADDAVREAARHALARLRGPDVDPAILAAVQEEEDENVRAELIHGLPARYCKLAVAPLFGFAQDESEAVRAAAFAALGQLAADGQVSRLLGLLVRETGEEAGQAAEDAVVAICLRDTDRERRVGPVLLAYQAEEQTAGRVSLIRVLGRLQGNGALASIRPAVRDQDEAVAVAAVRALSAWEDIVVLDDLRRLAQSEKQTHHVLALRGYVRLVRLPSDRPASETVRLLQTAMSLTRRAEERRLILGALGDVKDIAALKIAGSGLENPEVAEEASAAVVSIARGIAGRHPEEARNALDEVAHRRASDGAVKQAQEAVAFIEQHAGYVGVWLYAGPYSQEGKGYDDVFAATFAPETEDAKTENWQELLATQPDNPWIFDLTRVQRCGNCCLYVRTGIWSEVEQPARLEIGSDDGVKAWLNGELVHSNPSHRGLTVGEDKLEITLRPGRNELMLKIVQTGGGWGFSCAVRAPDGEPIPGLKFEAK